MIRRLVVATVLALAALNPAAPAQADALDRVREAGILRVANTQGHAPWDFLDETGALTGLGVELTEEIARRIGVPTVEFVPARFSDLIPGIEAGRFDLVVAGHTITDERRKIVEFSEPYMVVGTSVFVRAGDTRIGGLEDLPGKMIGVLAGSVQEGYIATNYPGGQVTVRTYENPTQALADLSFGRVDGVIYSDDAGSYIAKERDLDVVRAVQVDREINAMVIRKGETALKAAVDEALWAMIEDGTYSRMSAEWLGGLDMAQALRELQR